MQKFIDLEWIPGGLHEGSYKHENYRRLYLAHGWPSNFNGAAVEVTRKAWEDEQKAQYKAEGPFREVEKPEGWLKGMDEYPPQRQLEQLEEEIRKPGYNDQSADGAEGGKQVYESRPKHIMRMMATPKERRALNEKELEHARKEMENVPRSMRLACEERIKKYGY
jgi:hypothetical protein